MPKDSQPDEIYVQVFGCTNALIELIQRLGKTHIRIMMSSEQRQYANEHMLRMPNGTWVRKAS